jgi:hypothetical protein
MDYLCDEVVEFVDARYPTLAGRDHRGLPASPPAATARWWCR